MSETEIASFPPFNGYITVSKDAYIGMITLRGALNSKGLGLAVGKSLPKERSILDAKDMQVAWMSPDELMVLCPKENVAKLEADFQKSLESQHALVADDENQFSAFTHAAM